MPIMAAAKSAYRAASEVEDFGLSSSSSSSVASSSCSPSLPFVVPPTDVRIRYERDFLLSLRHKASPDIAKGIRKFPKSLRLTPNESAEMMAEQEIRDSRLPVTCTLLAPAVSLESSKPPAAPVTAIKASTMPAIWQRPLSRAVISPPEAATFVDVQDPDTLETTKIPNRIWKNSKSSEPPAPAAASFSIFTWNILAPSYCTPDLFPFAQGMTWDARKLSVLANIARHSPDIVCLQEVPQIDFSQTFAPTMHSRGYRSVFRGKNRNGDNDDGCAMFWRINKFRYLDCHTFAFPELVHNILENDTLGSWDARQQRAAVPDQRGVSHDLKVDLLRFPNLAMVVTLKCIATNRKLKVATTHLHWNPKDERTKLLQTALLMDLLESQCASDKSATDPIPIVLAGDLNSMNGERVMDFLVKGSANVAAEDFAWIGKSYGRLTCTRDSPTLRNPIPLLPTYPSALLPYTNKTLQFAGSIDHILMSNDLVVTDVLGGVPGDWLDTVKGLPCEGFVSDHIALCAMLSFKDPHKKRRRQRGAKSTFEPEKIKNPKRTASSCTVEYESAPVRKMIPAHAAGCPPPVPSVMQRASSLPAVPVHAKDMPKGNRQRKERRARYTRQGAVVVL
ncbi:Endonuclease/exonuclease/phosphatase [Phlyctochytrium arcticum]|nr:Endonuclease/exonuclease/phosphatase [Phlyctochytrium arcticum]